MSSLPTFPRRAVADLFLARQQLDRPRDRRLGAASLAALAEATGGIQLDSINVVARAHLLTLWSRFGAFDVRTLDRLVYDRRVLFEYWAHAACLVSAADASAWRRVMADYSTEHRGWSGWLQKNEDVVRAVADAIAARGPLSSSDFADDRAERGASGWWNWKPASHALDWLWMTGRILVHSRVGFQKRYDLADRVLPGWSAVAPLAPDAFPRWHLRKSLAAMGAATETDLRLYLTFPRLGVAAQRARLRAALADGEVVEIAVDGDRARWFVLAEDVPALDRVARRPPRHAGTTFLAPFDSLLWHRGRTLRLFDFDYRIEVYTPAAKRRFGYYTLPILSDGRLVGRVDVKHHRDERRLALRHVAFEETVTAREAGTNRPGTRAAATARAAGAPARPDLEAVLAGTADAARSLATFVGADAVTVERTTPARLRVPLRRALG